MACDLNIFIRIQALPPQSIGNWQLMQLYYKGPGPIGIINSHNNYIADFKFVKSADPEGSVCGK